VGLPLALEFARAGFHTTGIDVDPRRVELIRCGRSYIVDVRDRELAEQVEAGRLTATTDFAVIRDCDTINICVPTPLRKTKDPDLSHVVAAVDEIRRHLRRGQLVILESTTYPGTTEEVVQPALEASGLNIGLVNEVALMCHALGINVWEVIEAAQTKPFGFMAFYPGPGLGGHCIPIDPFYLSWKAKMNGFEPRFIELAGHINESMPRFVV